MKKLLPLFLVAIALIAIVLLLRRSPGEYTMNPTTVPEQDTEVRITAVELAAAFEQDETGANEAYLNKIVEVSGHIASANEGGNGATLILATNSEQTQVRCRMDRAPGEDHPSFKVGESIRLKCVCSGYVKDVEMVQCVGMGH